MLLDGRRFVLRAHALLLRAHPAPRAWLHADVLVLPYSTLHDPASDTRAVHVSQLGAGHPRPFALAARSGLLPDVVAQLAAILRQARPAAARARCRHHDSLS
jgi:hypothetical protein